MSRTLQLPADLLRFETPRPVAVGRGLSDWVRGHSRGLVFGLWVVVAVAVGVKAAAAPARHTVWPIFAGGSAHFWTGEPLYGWYAGLDLYRYSPTFAVAVTPLAVLPVRVGGCLWGVLSVGLLFGGLRALVRDVFPPLPTPRAGDAVLAVAAVAAGLLTWNLQSNALVLALVAYGAAAVVRRQWWAAAVFLAVPVFVKVWPAAAALLFAACWPRHLIGRLAAAGAGLAAVPFLVAPAGVVAARYANWVGMLCDTQGGRWPGFRDVLTVWELTGRPADPTEYHLLQAAGGAAALAACLLARRAGGRRPAVAVGLTAWACWQLLLGPGSEQCAYGMAVPLVAWWAAADRWRGGATVTAAVVLLFSVGEVERAAVRQLPGARAVLPVAVAAFAGWLAVRGWPVLRGLAAHVRRPAGDAAAPTTQPVALIPR